MSERGGGSFLHQLIERSMRVGMPISGFLFSIWMINHLLSAFSGVVSVGIVLLAVWLYYRRHGG
jgi:hypothetical protein